MTYSSELKEQIPDEISYLGNGSQYFLTSLGYNNWTDYQMNERKNIKQMEDIDVHLEDGRGR